MHQITWLMLILNAGAVFRLSRLTTTDTILNRPRNWFNTNYHGAIVTLVNCDWCISVWLGTAAALLTFFFWPTWMWITLVLTVSAVTGFVSERS